MRGLHISLVATVLCIGCVEPMASVPYFESTPTPRPAAPVPADAPPPGWRRTDWVALRFDSAEPCVFAAAVRATTCDERY